MELFYNECISRRWRGDGKSGFVDGWAAFSGGTTLNLLGVRGGRYGCMNGCMEGLFLLDGS